METELKDLIGKKVLKVFANSECMRFMTDGGNFTYVVTGDCCSSSYFQDFFGLKNLKDNGPIKEIKEVDLIPGDVQRSNSDKSDVIQVYGYQITTEGNDWGDVTTVFSFRNSSNGYYGGSISKTEFNGPLPELMEDTFEIK